MTTLPDDITVMVGYTSLHTTVLYLIYYVMHTMITLVYYGLMKRIMDAY